MSTTGLQLMEKQHSAQQHSDACACKIAKKVWAFEG